MKANKNQIQDPAVQKTYATEAAMHLDQANQKKGYLYVVTGVGHFEKLATSAGVAGDYRRDIPKEHEINGTRIDNAAVTGTYNIDWNAGSQLNLTPSGAGLTMGNTNLPTGTDTKFMSGRFNPSTTPVTFPSPAFKAAANNDALSATLATRITLETFPDYILYTLENIPA